MNRSRRHCCQIGLAAAVTVLKRFCPKVAAGVRPLDLTSAPALKLEDDLRSRVKVVSSLPDSADVAAAADCVNRITVSGAVSDVSSGFQDSEHIVQFVVNNEFVARCCVVGDAQKATVLEWLKTNVGRNVVCTGRLKMELRYDTMLKRMYQVPQVWISGSNFGGSVYALPITAPEESIA